MATSEKSVVMDVLNDLRYVCFRDVLTMCSKSPPMRCRFSRTRSKTTIVSLIEYPMIVRMAAMNGVPISTLKDFTKMAKSPIGMITSWNAVNTVMRPYFQLWTGVDTFRKV